MNCGVTQSHQEHAGIGAISQPAVRYIHALLLSVIRSSFNPEVLLHVQFKRYNNDLYLLIIYYYYV